MFKKIIPILIILTTSPFFETCKKDDNPISSGASVDLLPFKIGNQWAFEVTTFDSTGKIQFTAADTIAVLSDTVIQGAQWFITNNGIYRSASDGVWVWRGLPLYVYKYPVATGDTFHTTSATVKVISTNEQLTVPKGTLTCYHYQQTNTAYGGYQSNDYLCPGVGFVSLEEGRTTVGGSRWYVGYRMQLKSYTLH